MNIRIYSNIHTILNTNIYSDIRSCQICYMNISDIRWCKFFIRIYSDIRLCRYFHECHTLTRSLKPLPNVFISFLAAASTFTLQLYFLYIVNKVDL